MSKRLRRTTIDVVAVTSLLVALLAAAGLTPRAAHAAGMTTVEVFHLHQDAVTSNFDSTDSTGCIETMVILDAANSVTANFTAGVTARPPGGPQRTARAVVVINQFDNCTGSLLFDGFGSTSVINLHEGPNLSTATLAATVPITNEVTGDSFNLAVNVTWRATASVVREKSHSHMVVGNIIINSHLVAPTRDAVATGTISAAGTNFIPAPSINAQIMDFTSGEITIMRG